MSDGLVRSVARTHGFEPLRVEGAVPDGLRGTLFRAGPGLMERFGRPLLHPFEADGAITGVRFADEVTGACRIVESPGYLAEEAAGKPLYGSATAWWRRIGNRFKAKGKATGNTSTLLWQDRLFALMEGNKPMELAPGDLSTLGKTDLGVIPASFSAHPHRVPSRETTFNFGLRYDRDMHVDLFALPDRGEARKIGEFTAPWSGLLHDFVVTENHMVFVIGPAKMVLWKVLLGFPDFAEFFRWDPSAGTEVVVLPLDDLESPIRIPADPFWVWHFANGFELDGQIVLDCCRYPDLDSLIAIADDEADIAPSTLWRMTIDPTAKTVHSEERWAHVCEFPSVHPARVGTRHETVFAYAEDADQGFQVAAVVPDTGDAAIWAAPEGHLGSEPVFVPRSPEERDGWLLSLVLDPEPDRSYLAVLDAQRLADGPVCKAWFDHPIPRTFHGTFARTE